MKLLTATTSQKKSNVEYKIRPASDLRESMSEYPSLDIWILWEKEKERKSNTTITPPPLFSFSPFYFLLLSFNDLPRPTAGSFLLPVLGDVVVEADK